MKKVQLLGVAIALLGFSSFAQEETNYIKGDVLIQVTENFNQKNLLSDFEALNIIDSKLISADMRIWKIQYNNSDITIEKAIEMMYQRNYVVTAQRNHKIQHRAVPNDNEFNQQWQYQQSNDKDIDAVEAWDETTGGLTATGDTIVVCVIDDGVRETHPDLAPNLWRNYHEIPNNNIDDDGNGYIDDVRGWNPSSSNDNVAHAFWQGHGSAVAGIVGAKGNNNIGVAGVNWDVKLMIVKGGGNEAQAISAYSYALANRKLYNSTNGNKGAFVVATNASWGVNNGLASQAPLWCAMYDTLGNYGVLSAGAGPNVNTNVDVDGDLPTQCPSDYLITLTNTDSTDTKVTQAGYGTNSIDLGAPGQGAYTVAQYTNGYAGFGGTSGATPHVAGTIGLLYSVNCLNFANLAKNNPKAAAEAVKNFIMTTTDPLASLNGITVTEGRLNVNGAVQALKNNCVALELENISSSSFTVFPNPTNENLTVSFPLASTKTIRIFDVLGKTHSILTTSKITEEINVSQLKKGSYFIEITSDENKEVQKFVVQ